LRFDPSPAQSCALVFTPKKAKMPPSSPNLSVPPDIALARLRAGNRRFVSGAGEALRQWHPGLVNAQRPFAVVLGCADSRAPAEFVFDQGLGDLFVIRVAGNIVAPSLVGSVEFAAENVGVRLVVVMGHTQCGAVGATVRTLSHPIDTSKNQMSIVNRIRPQIAHLANRADLAADPQALYDAAVTANALASARELRLSSPSLQEMQVSGRVAIVAAVYDLSTGVVTFLEE
jgi:carbonic anhydrase